VDAPGKKHQIDIQNLPKPYATKSVFNDPRVVSRPAGSRLQVPEGFEIELFTDEVSNPRMLATAPNGDIFVVESKRNRIRLLRDAEGDGKPERNAIFMEGLDKPFGLAFYPPGGEPTHLYIANTGEIVRIPYQNGDEKAQAMPEKVASLSPGGELHGGGHWTRDIVFSADGKKLYASVGSLTNVDEEDLAEEDKRARIYQFNPDGSNREVYATGIRNPVGLAIHPQSSELWASVNERDGLGDNLVPDYVTRVKKDGFYGWPWFYIGGHVDPRHKNDHPDRLKEVLNPDVPITAHSATLNMEFYSGGQFPEDYKGDAFAAFHGSWNRKPRTGYKVVRIPIENGKPQGFYEDFVTGFIINDSEVWGRPVGLAVMKDGSLLMSEDGNDTIWRIRYTAQKN